MSKEIKNGIFGMSRGGAYYDLMNDEDAIEIVAVCERRKECVKGIIERNECPVFADFDEFMAYGKDHGMNAVFLANFFNEHAPYAIKVMEAGMAAISETLPASTLKEAVELVRAKEKLNGKYMFTENYPFIDTVQCIEESSVQFRFRRVRLYAKSHGDKISPRTGIEINRFWKFHSDCFIST